MFAIFKKKSLILSVSAVLFISPLSSVRSNPAAVLLLNPQSAFTVFTGVTAAATALMVGMSSSVVEIPTALPVPTTNPMTLSGFASRLFSSLPHMTENLDREAAYGDEGQGTNETFSGISEQESLPTLSSRVVRACEMCPPNR